MTLTVRSATVTGATTKGSALTHAELDENFNHLSQSSNHSFTPSGSGALSRTMQDKAREVISTADFVNDLTGATTAVADLVEAYTAASGKILEFTPGTYLIDSAITFPATVTCRFKRGATLKINDSVTVRFYAQPEAGKYQIFNIVGTDADEANWGDVAFNDSDSAPTTPYAHVVRVKTEWWGATSATSISGDDSTDAFRKCFRSYKPIARDAAMARVVVELDGTYSISDTVYVHLGYSMCGVGVKPMVIGDAGSAAFTMFKLGGYLASGTTETIDTGSYFPAPEISNLWFRATGANAASTSMIAVANASETGIDDVVYSFLISKCWFATFVGVSLSESVTDSSIKDSFFDSNCQRQVDLTWTTTSSRPIAGGLTLENCSFLPVQFGIRAQYWSQLIINNCRAYLGNNADAKFVRIDNRCGSIQCNNTLVYTLADVMGDDQHAFYASARIDDLAVSNCVFENIANVVYKDGASSNIFGSFTNCRMSKISKVAFNEGTSANNSLGHIRVEGCEFTDMLDRAAVLTSRATFKDNNFTVNTNPPTGSASTGGLFTLTLGGQTTAGIAYNASTTDVKDALELLSTVDTVTVTGSAGAFVVEFTGTHASSDVDLMTGSAASLTPSSAIRILKSQIGNSSTNTKQTVEYAQLPTSGSNLAAIVLNGAAGGGASNSLVTGNFARTSGWLAASYKQSSLTQADLTGIVSANNKGNYNADTAAGGGAVYVECTRSRLSNEVAVIESWDNTYDDITTNFKATTGNTATALFAGTLYHEGSHVYMDAMVCAKDQADPSVENAMYKVEGAIKLEAGASTLLNSTTTAIFENTGTMDAAIVDSTGGNIELQVTGVTGVTIRWVAKLNTVLL
jgi:hypothetical protein